MTLSDDETQIVLLLDLASEHPIREDLVLRRVPDRASARVYRLTDYGVPRCSTGTPDDWRPVIAAIEDLVFAARQAEREGHECRYWVAGRAGLPAFFHVGYLLSSRAAVMLINQRKTGEIDELVLDATLGSAQSPGAAPYFTHLSPPDHKDRSGRRVGLLASSRIEVPADQASDALSTRGTEPAGILEAQAKGALDATVLASAVRELDQMVAEVLAWYPDSKSLAAFVAGPSTLAFLLGRAIPANLFPDVQVFDHRDQQYQFAYETMPKHTILFLASNPRDMTELELRREAEEIQRELSLTPRRDRFQIVSLWAAQQMDLLRELRRLRPSVLHVAGHGSPEGLYFQSEDGDPRAMSPEVLAEVLDAVGATVRLVVLNACDSARQVEALVRRVPAAVGMTGAISDAAARSFAVGFYGGLGEGEPLSAAFQQGRVAILLGETTSRTPGARDVVAGGAAEACADNDRPRLAVRDGIDPDEWVLVRRPRRP